LDKRAIPTYSDITSKTLKGYVGTRDRQIWLNRNQSDENNKGWSKEHGLTIDLGDEENQARASCYS
jgi:hypothetical protein